MEPLTAKQLALYLGCQCHVSLHFYDTSEKKMMLGADVRTNKIQVVYDNTSYWYNAKYIRPMLRPLTDMTEIELVELKNLPGNQKRESVHGDNIWIHFSAQSFAWAIEKQFDIFYWIEAKLALPLIDTNPLK